MFLISGFNTFLVFADTFVKNSCSVSPISLTALLGSGATMLSLPSWANRSFGTKRIPCTSNIAVFSLLYDGDTAERYNLSLILSKSFISSGSLEKSMLGTYVFLRKSCTMPADLTPASIISSEFFTLSYKASRLSTGIGLPVSFLIGSINTAPV